MTSKSLEKLHDRIDAYNLALYGTTTKADARTALVKWVEEYGAAQRREGRRDAKGRVSSRVERGEK